MQTIKILFLFLFIFETLVAQESSIEKYYRTILEDAEIFIIDGYNFYTYPFHMSQPEWLGAAGVGIGTYMFIHNDDNLRNKIGYEVDKYDSEFWRATEKYGVVQYAEAAGVTIYALGLFTENSDIRTMGRMVIQSLTYSGLTAMFLRMIAGRKRPPFTDDPKNFLGFTSNNNYQSFPSGHATVAFAFSTIMAEYIDSPWSRIGFYGLAGLSAAERLINSQHWFSDVAVGAALGILSGIHVLNEETNRKNGNKSKLSIIPGLNGLTLQYRIN